MSVRLRGYYWIKFPYAGHGAGFIDVPEHWEIGSWDPDGAGHAGAWALIGSKDIWLEFQIKEVGPRIEPPDE